MSGWDDAWQGLPAGWETRRIRTVAELRTSNVDKKKSEDEVPVRLCNYTDVYYGDRISDASDLMEASATPKEIERFRLRRGDVLLTKDSESRDDIAVPAYVARDFEDVLCGYHLAIVRPCDGVLDGRFLHYCLLSDVVSDQFAVGAHGITRFGLSQDVLNSARLPLPPLEVQRTIASFLARETERIDTLIEKKRRLLELLEEKRTALITRAVTKGLDPDVPMKDSGVEWLGEIPEHWEVVRNGMLFRQVDDRGFPDLPLLEVSINTGVRVRQFSDDRIEQQAADWSTYKRARAGDIAFNKMRMWQGAVGVAPVDGLVSPDYTVARTREGAQPGFFGILFRTSTFLIEVNRHSHGIVDDRNRLYWQGFKQIEVPRPPVGEQVDICDRMKSQSERMKTITVSITQAISLLQEYRTALISAAVTGKIDVRDRAPA